VWVKTLKEKSGGFHLYTENFSVLLLFLLCSFFPYMFQRKNIPKKKPWNNLLVMRSPILLFSPLSPCKFLGGVSCFSCLKGSFFSLTLWVFFLCKRFFEKRCCFERDSFPQIFYHGEKCWGFSLLRELSIPPTGTYKRTYILSPFPSSKKTTGPR